MNKLQPFTKLQRAMTVAGMGPALLMGCGVHDQSRAVMFLPAPNYSMVAAVKPDPIVRPPAPRALSTQLNSLVRGFDGKVGVAVTSIDDNWIASVNGDRRLPQQSVSKLWVALTVLDQRDQGKLTLDDQVTITASDFTLFHQPVAYLVEKNGSYRASIGELLRRSMQMSDNTCNDKLLKLAGGPQAVRDFIARNSLGAIRFGPGERDLQALTAGLKWKPEYSKGGAFQMARSRLDPTVRLAAFETYVSDPVDGASPVAITNALARLKKGELLSPSSTAWLIQTMEAARTGKARLRGAIPAGWSFGHKTGTGQDLKGRTAGFNDVGILTAPNGKSYAVAVMIGDTPRPVRERQQLMQNVAATIVANHR